MDLRLLAVTRRYGAQVALDRVSLHVREGDCYGFLGHNGAGKTTALRIALGLIRPGAGRVWVDGFDALRHPREARARMGGLIEVPSFYDWLTGRQNLRLLAELGGMGGREASREADRLLEAVGLQGAGTRRTGAYSQGMRQRLGIAQALLGRPRMVLLDEPISGLDPEGIEAIRSLLWRLTREEGQTVLLSSHQLQEIAGLCNRIGILRQGRMLVEAETERLLASEPRPIRLHTERDELAWQSLERRGIKVEAGRAGALLLWPAQTPPHLIARDLVAEGFELHEFAPVSPTLEEIYLRFTRGEAVATEAAPAACVTAPVPALRPARRLAPARPVSRVFRQETRLLVSRAGTWIALLLPALLGALAVARLHARAEGHLREVQGGTLIGASQVTAFEGVAVAFQAGLPLLGLILAGLASQSLAGELARGTLRNLALRPVTRAQLAFGKALGDLAAALLGYALLCIAAFLAASLAFDFGDVVEVMQIRSAEPWVLVGAAELWPVLRRMVPLLAVPLAAATSLGFLAGALTSRDSLALGLSAAFLLVLDLGRELAQAVGAERWLLSAYLLSPLRDTSYAARLLGLIRAPNDPPLGFPECALIVPALWIAACLVLSALCLRRRSIP